MLTQETNAVVPVAPAKSNRGERRSFWRRIAPARAGRKGPDASEALSAQLEALASQLAASEQASVECGTFGALNWDCFATWRNKIVEISQGDHICGDPRAWGL